MTNPNSSWHSDGKSFTYYKYIQKAKTKINVKVKQKNAIGQIAMFNSDSVSGRGQSNCEYNDNQN